MIFSSFIWSLITIITKYESKLINLFLYIIQPIYFEHLPQIFKELFIFHGLLT